MDFTAYSFGSKLYKQALELRHRILRAPLGLDLYAEDLESEKDQLHFALVKNGQMLATVTAVPLDQERVKIRQMAVDTEKQSKGYGSKLFSESLEELKKKGFSKFELAARTTALDFYRKYGFETVGEEMMEVTVPHFKMIMSS